MGKISLDLTFDSGAGNMEELYVHGKSLKQTTPSRVHWKRALVTATL